MTKNYPSRGGSRASRQKGYPMDPDRFQMKDMKRRIKSLEDTLERQIQKIRLNTARSLETHVCSCGKIKKE